jgi:outer membrane protein TolC
VRNQIRVEGAQTEQALESYEKTVLNALEDVENAMVSYIQERVRREDLEQSVTAARKSVEHVIILYKTGLTDFQDVQLMELFKFEQEDQLADSKGKVIQNLISIYRSLGGGWDHELAIKYTN